MKKNSYALSNTFKRKKYLKYNYGSYLDPKIDPELAGSLATTGAGIIDVLDDGNAEGRQHIGSTVAKGALAGAAAGSIIPGLGTVVGGLVGGTIGLIKGIKEKKTETNTLNARNIRLKQMENNYMGARLAADPSLYQGYKNAEYFANGGKMSVLPMNQPTIGGKLVKKSSDGAEVDGRSHGQGGVKMPGIGAEVENKETLKGDYVFSKELGFADKHKPIMKAKGKIEKKPFTRERVNSIRLLEEQEQNLMLSQEYLKNLLHLK